MARSRRKSSDTITLIGRGNVLSFEMADGSVVALPDDYVMVHDPTNRHVRSCTLALCKCAFGAQPPHSLDPIMRGEAEKYFGSGAELMYAMIDLPDGPWKLVGDVAQVFYDRQGMYDDSWFHPYKRTKPPVQLFRNEDETGYLLSLPDHCEVTERGFVWP